MSRSETSDRLLHAKGMRASLQLLFDDPALDPYPYARAVVHDHLDRCNAMVEMLEASDA